MVAFCGANSASTRFCAKELRSTPEPAPREVTTFCAAALEAAVAALSVALLVTPDEVVAVLLVLLTELIVVAMVLDLQDVIRLKDAKLEGQLKYLNRLNWDILANPLWAASNAN